MRRAITIVLPCLILVLSCKGQQVSNQAPVKVETLNSAHAVITLNYFDSRLIPLDAQIKDVTNRAFSEMVTLFNGLPRDLSGNQYRAFTINLRYGPGEGEADPGVINIQLNEQLESKPFFGYITWKLALIHEMFHFWNGESFRNSTDREQWFNEGVTEYYAFRIAIKLGFIERENIPARLGLPIGYYLGDSGTGNLSISEAGVGESKFRHYFLVYCGGLVAAMVLDYDVRLNSGRTKSLDHLVTALYANYKRHEKLYTNADLLNELNRVTGGDYKQFFSRYITGNEIIPVGQYFNVADLHFYFLGATRRFDPKSPQALVLKEMFYLEHK